MQRRHFEIIAASFRQSLSLFAPTPANLAAIAAIEVAAENMADALAGTNPSFDRERFMAACGF